MAGEVVDLRTRAGFVPAEPDRDEWSPEAPQPPDGYSEAEQRAWWDGWTARHNHEERAAEATLIETSRFIQGQRAARVMPPLYPVS